AALAHGAGEADAELAAQIAGEGVGLRVGRWLEHHLGESGTVAQIDEDAAAVIAARVHPAEEDHALASVGAAQGAAVVGPLQIGQELGHGEDFTCYPTHRRVSGARSEVVWPAALSRLLWRGGSPNLAMCACASCITEIASTDAARPASS